ncbi:DinB family protein [Pseudalkalibacillus hwajinpoensis]|uniref:DinB family protein n=1 Tax=Guptibacillus hwajinpoensis TaxID=208199 RepID=UPI00325B176D
MNLLKEQYDWIKHTRKLLFHFCEKINQDDYLKEIDTFDGKSIRSLHQHTAECYYYWLGKFSLKDHDFSKRPNQVVEVSEMRELFEGVDQLVYRFLDEFEGRHEEKISRSDSEQQDEEEFSILWLFTHTTTHEFHHKGQIVWMARHLGYEPPDTDLIKASDINRFLAYPEQG